MNALRNVACVMLAAASLLVSPAYATSFSNDQSDLYYIPDEAGWGMQLVQRGSVIFATLFVYDKSGKPTWYTATMDNTTNLSWNGTLYATTGTYFGAPWNPAALTLTPVGTMTWAAQTMETGILTYVVNGVMVTKNVVRQALVLDDYSGTYLAALHVAVTGCTLPANDTPPTDIPLITISVTQTGSSATFTFSDFGLTLTFSGTLGQNGQFGTLIGTYSDSTGEVGNVSVSAMNVQLNSITASFSQTSTNDGCQSVGYFAGMRSQQ